MKMKKELNNLLYRYIIINNMEKDFVNYFHYLLDSDIIEQCKKEAFERIKEDVVKDMMKKIKESI